MPLGPRPPYFYGPYPGAPHMYPAEFMGRGRFPPGEWGHPERDYRYDPRL